MTMASLWRLYGLAGHRIVTISFRKKLELFKLCGLRGLSRDGNVQNNLLSFARGIGNERHGEVIDAEIPKMALR
jgi:hypothetical protein